ncbi:zinc finger protein 208-like [Eurosta solidaginis]|uniref:zinc finger protein 208-like n=1 Tax=Eurosta solidaginis TaxID=178769 RepID=UPI0035316BBA
MQENLKKINIFDTNLCEHKMHAVIEEECHITKDKTENWQRWCRLCAKCDANNINIFHKDENTAIKCATEYNGAQISLAIGKHFDVQMKHGEKLPMQICTDCLFLMTHLINFNKRVIRVQQMYFALQHLNDNPASDIREFRVKYGVLENDEPHVFMYNYPKEMHLDEEKPEIDDLDEEETFIDMLDEPCTAVEIKVENFNDFKPLMTDEDVCDFEMLEDSFSDITFNNEDGGNEMSDPCSVKINDKTNTETEITNFNQENQQPVSNKTKQKKNITHNQERANDAADEKMDEEPYSCIECSKVFKIFGYYRSHMEREHAKTAVESRYTCSECAISFNTKNKLKYHRYQKHMPIKVRKKYPCPCCEQKLSTKSAVDQHIRFVHMHERPVICEECGTGVRTKSELIKHMLIHTDTATFECEICKKCFKSDERLKKHLQIHSPTKLICPECGLRLNSRSTLNNHLLVHSDVRKHKCDYCERSFKRSKELKNHLILHTGLKLYSCDFCDKKYARASNLRTHKRYQHPKEIAALDAGGVKPYSKDIPKLVALKSVVQSAENLTPVICRKFGERSVIKPYKASSDRTICKKIKAKTRHLSSTITTDAARGNVNKLRDNLLSVRKLTKAGVDVTFCKNETNIIKNGELLATAHLRDGLYEIEIDVMRTTKACKLRKSLYGLKQSPRCWHQKLNQYLLEIGFSRSNHDYCVYTKFNHGDFLIVIMYVDGLLIAGKHISSINWLKTTLSKKFQMSDCGTLKYFLGIKIETFGDYISLSQESSIDKRLSKFGTEECNYVRRPMEKRLQLYNIENNLIKEININTKSFNSEQSNMRYNIENNLIKEININTKSFNPEQSNIRKFQGNSYVDKNNKQFNENNLIKEININTKSFNSEQSNMSYYIENNLIQEININTKSFNPEQSNMRKFQENSYVDKNNKQFNGNSLNNSNSPKFQQFNNNQNPNRNYFRQNGLYENNNSGYRKFNGQNHLKPMEVDSLNTVPNFRLRPQQRPNYQRYESYSTCRLCCQKHFLRYCNVFMAMTPEERYESVRAHKYCINCLATSHVTGACDSLDRCRKCGLAHHTLLHRQQDKPPKKQKNRRNVPKPKEKPTSRRVVIAKPKKKREGRKDTQRRLKTLFSTAVSALAEMQELLLPSSEQAGRHLGTMADVGIAEVEPCWNHHQGFYVDEWKNWCRLCAKHNAQFINIISGHCETRPVSTTATPASYPDYSNRMIISHIIEEFFRVHIKEDEKLSQLVCTDCYNIINSMMKYRERVFKVQQMYDDLKNEANIFNLNPKDLYEKYNLKEDDIFFTNNSTANNPAVEEIFVADLSCANEIVANVVQNEVKSEEKETQEVPAVEVVLTEFENDEVMDPFGDDFGEDYAPTADDTIDSSSIDDNDDKDSVNMNSEASGKRTSKNIVTRSKRHKTDDKSNLEENNVDNDVPEEYNYPCKKCEQKFQRIKFYVSHMKKKHKEIICPQCPESCQTAMQLRQHIKNHTNEYACNHCDKKLESKGRLARHIRCAHENDNQPLICEVCGLTLRAKKQLKEHMLQHTDYAPYVCKVCGTSFKVKSRLKRHLQIHGDNYICPECGKQLNTRATLKSHLLVHSDKMAHKCDYCGRLFKRANTLKNHLIAHTDLRPYACDFCDKRFSTGPSCRFHKKTMHPKQLAELEASGAKAYTKNIPTLHVLKAVSQRGENLKPLASKQTRFVHFDKDIQSSTEVANPEPHVKVPSAE